MREASCANQDEQRKKCGMRLSVVRIGAAVVCVSALTGWASAGEAYWSYGSSYRAVGLPPVGAGSFDIKGDVLADGRIVAVTGRTIYLERGVGVGAFDAVATLDPAQVGAGTDPSFIRVSPDGNSIAVGGGFNKPVAVFSRSALGTAEAPTMLSGGAAAYFNVAHYDAEWADSTHLAMTAADFGSPAFVSLLDVTSSTAAPVNPVVIRNIGGSSSGISFDAAGNLYTGNGFDYDDGSGAATGEIRAFTPSMWSSPEGADFEAAGIVIGRALSAASMSFDLEGNLFVGGGDFGGESGSVDVIHFSAILDALAGNGPIDPSDLADLRRLDPLGTGLGYFGTAYNAVTGELYVTDGGAWYAAVPGPAGAGVLALFSLALGARRRRDEATF